MLHLSVIEGSLYKIRKDLLAVVEGEEGAVVEGGTEVEEVAEAGGTVVEEGVDGGTEAEAGDVVAVGMEVGAEAEVAGTAGLTGPIGPPTICHPIHSVL